MPNHSNQPWKAGFTFKISTKIKAKDGIIKKAKYVGPEHKWETLAKYSFQFCLHGENVNIGKKKDNPVFPSPLSGHYVTVQCLDDWP